MKEIPNEVNLVVDTILSYDNKNNLSWMKVQKEVLKELNMEDRVKDNCLLSYTVKEITKRGYDIIDEPFKLERFK